MNSKYLKNLWRGAFVFLLPLMLAFPSGTTVVRAAPGDVVRVSVDSSGAQANGRSFNGKISGDGRFVVFESDATNLEGGGGGLFLKDRQTGATTRISIDGEDASISNDARFIAYDSGAANLVNGDTNNFFDIFVYDRQSGVTTRISVDSSGTQANGDSTSPCISGDGRYVAFHSDASNLVSNDTNGVGDVFLRDQQTGAIERVSIANDGAQANAASLSSISMSADARIVAFNSSATNLVTGDTNGRRDTFARDRQAGTTTRVSVNSSGQEANPGPSDTSETSISADGRYVVFSSSSANIMSPEPLSNEGLYVHDRQTGTTTLASISSDGYEMIGWAEQGVISADGRYVAFQFDEKGDGLPFRSIYIHDLLSGVTISVPSGSRQESSSFPSISGDGRYLAYSTAASNLVNGDTNGMGDIFVYEASFSPDLSPTVVSVQPTCSGSFCRYPTDPIVSFRVTFSELVTGVTADDFFLTVTGGISGVTVASISGAGNVYVVNVNTGTGDGTLRLDVIDNDSIQDISLHPLGGAGTGNGNFTSGEVYLVDKNIPAVAGVTRVDPNPTGIGTVNFAVTFTEDVSGVDVMDFIPVSTGNIIGATISEVTGSGKSYNVKVNTGSGEGTLGLNVIDDDSIRDADNHPIGGNGTDNGTFTHGEVYTIDRVPAVFSSLRLDPNPTSADTINFTVTFFEEVSGVDVSDFMPVTTGGVSAVVVAGVNGAGNAYTVTVNIGAGDGTVRLDVLDNDSIVDAMSNPLGGVGLGNGNYTGGDAYLVEKNAPVVISSLRADANPTVADSIHFNVTFSETVSGVDAGDFMLITSGVTGASVTEILVSGNTCLVTVNTGIGSGTIRLDVLDNDSIVDASTVPLGGAGMGNGNFNSGETYEVNKIAYVAMAEKLRSTGDSDGWVLEANGDSGVGGSKNSTAATFILGDDSRNRQYRSILSFPTYYLPDSAVITRVILTIKAQGMTGTNPFTTHGNILVDIRYGPFGFFGPFGIKALQALDFQADSSMGSAAVIPNNPVGGWYWTTLDNSSFKYINLTGITQMRLAFQLDTNDDFGNDTLSFFSGDYPEQRDRPHLLIEYYTPK